MKKQIWTRKSYISQGFDPTEAITWKAAFGPVRIELGAFWDTITSTTRWKQHEHFTSDCIHPFLNRIAKWAFNKLEDAYQEELNTSDLDDDWGAWHGTNY